MLPDDILLKIFVKIKNPFKLQCVSKQFNTVLYNNKTHIAHGILQRLGFKPIVTESYRIYKNYVSKHDINNIERDLIKAIENGHTDVVELLLADKRVDPSAEDNIAIIKASEKGHTDTVKLLFYDPRVNALQNIK